MRDDPVGLVILKYVSDSDLRRYYRENREWLGDMLAQLSPLSPSETERKVSAQDQLEQTLKAIRDFPEFKDLARSGQADAYTFATLLENRELIHEITKDVPDKLSPPLKEAIEVVFANPSNHKLSAADYLAVYRRPDSKVWLVARHMPQIVRLAKLCPDEIETLIERYATDDVAGFLLMNFEEQKRWSDAEAAEQRCQSEWVEAMARMPAKSLHGLDPAAALEAMDQISVFRGHVDFRRGRLQELAKLKAEQRSWIELFDEVAVLLGDTVEEEHRPARVSTWKNRLDSARERDRERKSFADQILTKRQKFEADTARLAALEERLEGLRRESGAISTDGISEVLQQVDERLRHQLQLEADCEIPLRSMLDGNSLADFENRVIARAGEDLKTGIDDRQADLDRIDKERLDVFGTIRETEVKINEFQDRQGGLEPRAEMESALARMRKLIPDYLVTVLAEKVLDRAVERYRERNTHELFGSASAYFRRLTCGSFDNLTLHEDERGEPILVGLRGSARVPVSGMSEGTCDQLYLALRLAHLEKHVRDHGPFPVILDDILLTFDNERASAALGCLAELAAQTQILFFTHHPHLRDLALAATYRKTIAVLELEIEGV